MKKKSTLSIHVHTALSLSRSEKRDFSFPTSRAEWLLSTRSEEPCFSIGKRMIRGVKQHRLQ